MKFNRSRFSQFWNFKFYFQFSGVRFSLSDNIFLKKMMIRRKINNPEFAYELSALGHTMGGGQENSLQDIFSEKLSPSIKKVSFTLKFHYVLMPNGALHLQDL